MKKLLFILLISLISLVTIAQEYDDVYFTPSKDIKYDTLFDIKYDTLKISNDYELLVDESLDLELKTINFSSLSSYQQQKMINYILEDFIWNPNKYWNSYLWKMRYSYLFNYQSWDYWYYSNFMFNYSWNYNYMYDWYYGWNYNNWYYTNGYYNNYRYDHHYYHNNGPRRRSPSVLSESTNQNIRKERIERSTERRITTNPTTVRQTNMRKDRPDVNHTTKYRYPEKTPQRYSNDKRVDHRVYNKIDNESNENKQRYERQKQEYDRKEVRTTPRTNTTQPAHRPEVKRTETIRSSTPQRNQGNSNGNSSGSPRNNGGSSGNSGKRR